MSEYRESDEEPRQPHSLATEHATEQAASALDSVETPESEKMGRNGTGIENFRPTGSVSSEFQVQNPDPEAKKWDEMRKNGTEMGNSRPIRPTPSGSGEQDPAPAEDGDDAEIPYPELLRGLLEFLGSGEGEPESDGRKVVPLTPRQLSALPYLAACPSVDHAARVSGIGRSTLYRWLQDDHFRQELLHLRGETAEFARQEAKGLMLRAIDVFRDALNDRDVSVRLRAARLSLAYSTEVELAEKLRQEVDSIQTAFDEWKSRRPVP